MKDILKKAMDLAENEVQDKQIQYLKNIIKNLLQKKVDKEKEKDELEEEIKLIKQDIDDFKAGRLDKIKERHELNPKADKICPLQIIIINDNHRVSYPTQPWKWNYEIVSTNYSYYGNGGLTYGAGATLAIGSAISNSVATICGTTSATYTGGTYSVTSNGARGIINL